MPSQWMKKDRFLIFSKHFIHIKYYSGPPQFTESLSNIRKMTSCQWHSILNRKLVWFQSCALEGKWRLKTIGSFTEHRPVLRKDSCQSQLCGRIGRRVGTLGRRGSGVSRVSSSVKGCSCTLHKHTHTHIHTPSSRHQPCMSRKLGEDGPSPPTEYLGHFKGYQVLYRNSAPLTGTEKGTRSYYRRQQ